MVMLPTPKFQPSPCVMLVALDDLFAHRLTTLVSPMPTLRVQHVPAARERLLVTWPLALFVGGVTPAELESLREAAEGVGVELLQLTGSFHDGLVRGWFGQAVKLAASRRRVGG